MTYVVIRGDFRTCKNRARITSTPCSPLSRALGRPWFVAAKVGPRWRDARTQGSPRPQRVPTATCMCCAAGFTSFCGIGQQPLTRPVQRALPDRTRATSVLSLSPPLSLSKGATLVEYAMAGDWRSSGAGAPSIHGHREPSHSGSDDPCGNPVRDGNDGLAIVGGGAGDWYRWG